MRLMMMMMMMILIATTHRVCFTLFAVLYGVYESKSCCCCCCSCCHRRDCCCCCSSCCWFFFLNLLLLSVVVVVMVLVLNQCDHAGPWCTHFQELKDATGPKRHQEAITIFQASFLPFAFANLLSCIQFAVGHVFFQTLRVVGNRM